MFAGKDGVAPAHSGTSAGHTGQGGVPGIISGGMLLPPRKVPRHVLMSIRNLNSQVRSFVADCQVVFLSYWCCQKFSAFMILLV